MILHTIIDINEVMSSSSGAGVNTRPQNASAGGMQSRFVALKSGFVEVQNSLVSRVFSTDLKDYLNPGYSPGATYKERK